jgi:Cu-Zn family superoxide dismutase
MNRLLIAVVAALSVGVVLNLTGCAWCKQSAPSRMAVANLTPTKGNEVTGIVTFKQTKSGVLVTASVTGLTPGDHGFHIHEKGDCSAPDASSAGGHWNPTGHDHAGPDATHRHMGDFGNITADKSGKATYSRTFQDLSFDGPHSFLGKGVIVHRDPDDLKTQPTGNAGPRVACGVIVELTK